MLYLLPAVGWTFFLLLRLLRNNSGKITSRANYLLTLVHVWPMERSLVSSWYSWYIRCSWMQITWMPHSLVDATNLFLFSSELNDASVECRYKSVSVDPYNFCLCFGVVSVRYLLTVAWSLTEERSSCWTAPWTMCYEVLIKWLVMLSFCWLLKRQWLQLLLVCVLRFPP